MKQTIKIGLTVLVVTGLVMSGIALAQTSDDPELPAVEETPAYSHLLDRLEALVEDGTITESQSEAVARHLAEGSRFGHRPGHHHRGLAMLEEAAEFLGMSVDDLRAELANGATLADIAGTQTDALIEALVGVVEEKLDEAVANDRITETVAAEMLERATDRITTVVNEGHECHEPGIGPRGRFGRRGAGPGFGGPFGGEVPFEDTAA